VARGLIAIFVIVAMYPLTAVILGLIPANAQWTPPATGIEIFVRSNGIHTDFVVPARTTAADWTEFAPPPARVVVAAASHVAFGWGEKGFYIDTPTWEDLTLATAANAVLLPSGTAVHVTYYYGPPEESDRCCRLVVRKSEYRRLVDYLRRSFALDGDGKPLPIPGASYYDSDTFYEGVGSYHLFNTCNDWTNSGLKAMGVRAAMWAPFDHAILHQLARF